MKTAVVILPAFWASALINNDFSGLDAEDAATVRTWQTDTASAYGAALGCSDDEFYTAFHDARKYVAGQCACLDYVFPIVAPKGVTA